MYTIHTFVIHGLCTVQKYSNQVFWLKRLDAQSWDNGSMWNQLVWIYWQILRELLQNRLETKPPLKSWYFGHFNVVDKILIVLAKCQVYFTTFLAKYLLINVSKIKSSNKWFSLPNYQIHITNGLHQMVAILESFWAVFDDFQPCDNFGLWIVIHCGKAMDQ